MALEKFHSCKLVDGESILELHRHPPPRQIAWMNNRVERDSNGISNNVASQIFIGRIVTEILYYRTLFRSFSSRWNSNEPYSRYIRAVEYSKENEIWK